MRSLPFFVGMVTIELIQAVGEVTGAITSCLTRSSRASLTLDLSATGTRRGACYTGSTVLSSLMWCSPASLPTPSPKTLGYFSINASLVIGTCVTFSIVVRSSE